MSNSTHLLSALLIFTLPTFAQLKPTEHKTKQENPITTIITAHQNLLLQDDHATAKGHARIEHARTILCADTLHYDFSQRHARAIGQIRLYTDESIYAGDKLDYFQHNSSLRSGPFRFLKDNLCLQGESIETLPLSNDAYFYRIRNGTLSLDNFETPSFYLKARQIDYYPQQRVVLHHVTLHAGKVPFFWWPIYSQSLKNSQNNLNLDLGRDAPQGLFLKPQYAYAFTPDLTGRLLFDLRSRRGLAGGARLAWTPDEEHFTHFKAYYAQDNAPDYNPYAFPRSSTSASRHLFSLQQRLTPWPSLTLTTDFNRWSDPHVTEDFFKRQFRLLPQPDNFAELLFTHSDYTLSFLNRIAINPFFETRERTPELRLDLKRRPLFSTGFNYESQSSIAHLQFHAARDPHPMGEDYTAWRFDTLHQLTRPLTLFGWLHFTPRVGFRFTHWTRLTPLDSSASQAPNPARLMPILAADLSFKLHRTWRDFQSPALRLDGLRHLIEPSLSIQYIPATTFDTTPYRLWDRRLPAQRIPPINLLHHASIDDHTQELRILPRLHQKWQTRRDDQTFTWLDWHLFTEINPLRQFNEERHPDRRTLGNLHNHLRFTPFPWLRFDSLISLNLVHNNYTETHHSLTWQIHPASQFSIAHHSLHRSRLYPSSHLLTLRTFHRINETWQLSTAHTFEAKDQRLESSRITLYRDFTSWQLALSYQCIPHRARSTEHAVFLGFTLKAFPGETLEVGQ
ncbi:MAG: hypothetical protein NZM04_07120 [Methylacidiphilales bacterium]|nr:hypothetical protein [Candidatus Methylacidiphilales bacterium]MDW8349262.1 hypothetical protein [Verrucomicrobiae bacterium]